jgi:hypothetical protein
VAKPLKIRNEPDYFITFIPVIARALRPKQSRKISKNTELLRPFVPRNDGSEMFMKSITYELGSLGGSKGEAMTPLSLYAVDIKYDDKSQKLQDKHLRH